MKKNVTLIVTSLLSIVLVTFHFADDMARGVEPGGFIVIRALLTFILWLCGPLMFAHRRSGVVIMFLGGLFGCLMPLAHMRHAGMVGGRIAGTTGIFFWAWTLVALGVVSGFSAVLAARELWVSRNERSIKTA